MPGKHPQLGRFIAKPSHVFYLSDWLHVCTTQNREMGLKDLNNDCVRKHGQRSGQKQFIIGGEGTSGQSITTLVRLALLDQIALMQ